MLTSSYLFMLQMVIENRGHVPFLEETTVDANYLATHTQSNKYHGNICKSIKDQSQRFYDSTLLSGVR